MAGARVTSSLLILMSLVLSLFCTGSALRSDPELVTDFGITVTSGADLTFTGFRNISANPSGTFNITFAFISQFPALNGMGVAGSRLNFGPNSLNSLHSHPRGNEILFLLSGSIDVGIVDTANQLFTSTLQAGDAFVFPKGLLHFQINRSLTQPADALAAFSSENAGRLSIPTAIFRSTPRIDEDILERAFLDLGPETAAALIDSYIKLPSSNNLM